MHDLELFRGALSVLKARLEQVTLLGEQSERRVRRDQLKGL